MLLAVSANNLNLATGTDNRPSPGSALVAQHDPVVSTARSHPGSLQAEGSPYVGIPPRLIVGTSIPNARNCWNGFMNSRFCLIFPFLSRNECMKWFL